MKEIITIHDINFVHWTLLTKWLYTYANMQIMTMKYWNKKIVLKKNTEWIPLLYKYPIKMLAPIINVNKTNKSFHLFLTSKSSLNQKWLWLSLLPINGWLSSSHSTSELSPFISLCPISWSNSYDVTVADNYILIV